MEITFKDIEPELKAGAHVLVCAHAGYEHNRTAENMHFFCAEDKQVIERHKTADGKEHEFRYIALCSLCVVFCAAARLHPLHVVCQGATFKDICDQLLGPVQ